MIQDRLLYRKTSMLNRYCLQVIKLVDSQMQELQTYIARINKQNERFLYTFQNVSSKALFMPVMTGDITHFADTILHMQ